MLRSCPGRYRYTGTARHGTAYRLQAAGALNASHTPSSPSSHSTSAKLKSSASSSATGGTPPPGTTCTRVRLCGSVAVRGQSQMPSSSSRQRSARLRHVSMRSSCRGRGVRGRPHRRAQATPPHAHTPTRVGTAVMAANESGAPAGNAKRCRSANARHRQPSSPVRTARRKWWCPARAARTRPCGSPPSALRPPPPQRAARPTRARRVLPTRRPPRDL